MTADCWQAGATGRQPTRQQQRISVTPGCSSTANWRSPRSNSAGGARAACHDGPDVRQPDAEHDGDADRGTRRTSDWSAPDTTGSGDHASETAGRLSARISRCCVTPGVAPFSGGDQKVHVGSGDTVQPARPLIDFGESAAGRADTPVRLSRTTLGLPLDVAINGDRCCGRR